MSLISAFMIRVNSLRLAPSVLASAVGGRFARVAVGVLQLAEQRLERQLLALEGKAQRGDRLVEQPVPRRGARHRLFEEQLLELVAELVRPLLADVDEPRTIMGERRVARRRVEPRVVEPIELELEEQQFAGELGHLLLRVAEELGARRIAGVAGVKQRSVGHDAAHQVLQLFVGADRLEQALARVGALPPARRACPDRPRRSAWLPPRRARDRRRNAANPCLRRGRRDAIAAAGRGRPRPARRRSRARTRAAGADAALQCAGEGNASAVSHAIGLIDKGNPGTIAE